MRLSSSSDGRVAYFGGYHNCTSRDVFTEIDRGEIRDDRKHDYITILRLDNDFNIRGASVITLPLLNSSCPIQLSLLLTMTISTQSSALFPTLDGRLARNAEWAESIQSHTPDHFKDLVKGQQPEILWFGCESHPSLSATVV